MTCKIFYSNIIIIIQLIANSVSLLPKSTILNKIWQKLHRMTPTHTARAADLSHVTDRQTNRQTDTMNIGNNSLHLKHSMQPNNTDTVQTNDKKIICSHQSVKNNL